VSENPILSVRESFLNRRVFRPDVTLIRGPPLQSKPSGRAMRQTSQRGTAWAPAAFVSMIRRRQFHRIAFLAAGLYNIGWGIWSSLDPQWLFRFSGLPPLNHPSIFACLAMVVGLYGSFIWKSLVFRKTAG